jgi:hypothetical protein
MTLIHVCVCARNRLMFVWELVIDVGVCVSARDRTIGPVEPIISMCAKKEAWQPKGNMKRIKKYHKHFCFYIRKTSMLRIREP